jgi:hypothetical protein
MVAPNAATSVAETTGQGQAGGLANICHELAAYVQEQRQKAAGANAGQGGGQGGGAGAGAGGAPSGGPSGGGANPAAQGAAGPGQTAPPGDRPQQSSGQAAPIPSQNSGSTSPAASIDEAQSLAQAGDLRGCQAAAQKMRRAGVALPPGLIALAALREDLLSARR